MTFPSNRRWKAFPKGVMGGTSGTRFRLSRAGSSRTSLDAWVRHRPHGSLPTVLFSQPFAGVRRGALPSFTPEALRGALRVLADTARQAAIATTGGVADVG